MGAQCTHRAARQRAQTKLLGAAQNFGAALGGVRKKKAKVGAKAAAPPPTAGGRIDRFLARPTAAAAQPEAAQQVQHPPRLHDGTDVCASHVEQVNIGDVFCSTSGMYCCSVSTGVRAHWMSLPKAGRAKLCGASSKARHSRRQAGGRGRCDAHQHSAEAA